MKWNPDQLVSVLKPLWLRFRFYILILLATSVLLSILIQINGGEYIPENTIPAGLSLLNALVAYAVSKKKQGERSYKQMMRNIFTWTAVRFLTMIAVLAVFMLAGWVEPLPFIFSFIGFYIMHQLIEIGIMKRETK